MISTLGSWKNNFIPGITSTPKLAENVYKENVDFLLQNIRTDIANILFLLVHQSIIKDYFSKALTEAM